MRSWALLLLALLAPAQTGEDHEVRFEGTVRDEAGQPLSEVTVRVEGVGADTTSSLNGPDGTFGRSMRLLAREVTHATLTFSAPGFETVVRTVPLGPSVIQVGDVILKRAAPQAAPAAPGTERLADSAVPADLPNDAAGVVLTRTGFQSGRLIEGRVIGLDPASHGAYKVVAYVLTDKWYIHPWAVNTAGSGFAPIASDGTWSLSTVWRGYQATHLALLLVPAKTWVPPTVEAGGAKPEASLLRGISGVKAYRVEEAPDGI